MTHGGLMGTMEAIYYGVPMIGVPLFGDQHSNMHHYEREKIAILMKLETINADRFTNAIQNVLNTPLYRFVFGRKKETSLSSSHELFSFFLYFST